MVLCSLPALKHALAELIANAVDNEGEVLEAVRHAIGADTLSYISLHGMIAATEQPASRLCCACFDGKYPIAVPPDVKVTKLMLEDRRTGPEPARCDGGPGDGAPYVGADC